MKYNASISVLIYSFPVVII